jgi:hypothetical protein
MTGGVYKDGKILYVSRYAKLPARCIRCAKPVGGRPLKLKYSWHPWATYLLFPLKVVLPERLGEWIYDVLAHLGGGEELDLEVYVCDTHYLVRVLITVLGLGIWIAALIVAILIEHGGLFYGLLLLVVAHVCVRVLAIIPRPTYIDERYGTFKGAGAPFLDQLQPKPPLWLPTTLNL